jgi:hypothetical protein
LRIFAPKVPLACKFVVASMVLAQLWCAGVAEAQPAAAASETSAPRYTIARWQSHRSCPSQDYFRQALDKALGPSEAPGTQAPMELELRIESHKNRFQLELTTKDAAGSGTRSIVAARCDELLATAAVIVSLAMQPDLLFQNESDRQVETARYSQTQASDDESPGSVSRELREREIVLADEMQGRALLKIAVGLAAVTDVGTLPRPAIGLAVVASARAERWLLSFRLTQWAEQRNYVRSFKENRGGNFDYISATLDLCRDLISGKLSAGVCGLLGLGRLSGESITIDLPISQSHILANLGPAAFVHFATGRRSAIRIQGELVAQLVKPNFSAEPLDEMDDTINVYTRIHKVAPASARLAASWGVRF